MKFVAKNNVDSNAATVFIEKHRLFFHSAAWVNCYDENLRQLFILNNNNEITGCFLLYVYKKAFLKFVISPPYTPGIALYIVNPAQSLVNKQTYTKEVMTGIAGYIDALNAQVVDVQLSDDYTDVQPFLWEKFKVSPRFTYLIQLTQSEEALWNALSSEKRKSIGKADKDGLKIETVEAAQTAIPLIKSSLLKGGVLANESLLVRLLGVLISHPQAIAKQAMWNGKVVAVTLAVLDQNRCIYLFGGYDTTSSHHGAGVSCMWQTILEAKRNQLIVFDFEGSMNPGIERYYREFGGLMVSSHQIRKIKPWLTAFKRFRL